MLGDSRYQEASCGALMLIDKKGECLSKRQYGRMPETKKKTLKSQLEQDLKYILHKNPSLSVIKIADGARDNWAYFQDIKADGVEIFDFYHSSEHLKHAFDLAYGEKNSKSFSSYKKYREILLGEENGVQKIVNHLSYLCSKNPKIKFLKTERNYSKNNRQRMQYAMYKSLNYPIGSGSIEAICKTLVTQRLKCSGMQWDYAGGQAILTFRAFNHSELFDKAWKIMADDSQCMISAANDNETLPLFNVA